MKKQTPGKARFFRDRLLATRGKRTKLEKEILSRGLRVIPPMHLLTIKSRPLKMKGYKRCPCGSGKLLKNCCKLAYINRTTGQQDVLQYINKHNGGKLCKNN